MASVDREELDCPICLRPCRELLSRECGHTFCQRCIDPMVDSDDEDDWMVAYLCPVCEEEKRKRRLLKKNKKLSDIVEHFYPSLPKLETGHVRCTFCDLPTRAIKICLTCESSFCKKHLSNHNNTTIGHKLSKSIAPSQIQQMEARIQNLENHMTEEKERAAELKETVSTIISDMRRHLDELEDSLLTEISRQEELKSQTISDHIKRMEEQKDELSRKIQQEQELHKTTSFTFLKQGTGDEEILTKDKQQTGCLNEVMIARMLRDGLEHFSNCVKNVQENFQHVAQLKSMMSLDKDTAPNNISVDLSSQEALHMNTTETRPDNPKKFKCHQVLSNERFTEGRHYWEVNLAGEKVCLIGVAAESIERKSCGNESIIGYNEKSWSLSLQKKITACHDNIKTIIDSKCAVKRIGIFLDYDGGRLSFYQMCGPVRHLHTFIANFTEPLYAAFYVFEGSPVSFVSPDFSSGGC